MSSRRVKSLRKDLRASTCDGAVFSVMVGAGESYIVPFGLAIGMRESIAGLLGSVPLLIGALLQLIAPLGVRWVGSNRRWVVLSVTLQGLCFLPLALIALRGSAPAAMVFAVVATYWGAGYAAAGAWNTWTATLVPAGMRSNFFARRSRYMQIALLIALVAAGLLLHSCRQAGWGPEIFAIPFAIALVARLYSARMLSTISEPIPLPPGQRYVSPRELGRRMLHTTDGRLLAYMLAMQSAAYFAGPYFAPYMLEQLHFSYGGYMALLAVSYGARIVTLPLLGRFAKRYGTQALLRFGGLSIVPLAALWIGAESFAFLIVVQFLAGMTWAAYELGTFLYQFETIRQEERTSVLTTFNLANAMALTLGSMAGAVVLESNGATPTAYFIVFGASTLLRVLTVPLLLRINPAPLPAAPIAVAPMSVVASRGAIEQPVTASLPEPPDSAEASRTPASLPPPAAGS